MLSTTSPARRSRRSKRSGANTAPIDFDPGTHPIISKHWFGIEPPRPVAEDEVDAGADLDSALEDYERLTPDLLNAVGGDHFPPVPIQEVRS